MGIFSKLFGDNKERFVEPTDSKNGLAQLIGCQLQEISQPLSSPEIFELYKNELETGKSQGYVPVLLVPDGHLQESIECNYNDHGSAELYREKMLSADVSKGEALLKRLFDDNKEMFEDDFDGEELYGEFDDQIKPAKTFVKAQDCKLLLLRVPTDQPWKVFAWVPFGGWNECPDTRDMMAACKYWYEKYKAVPAVISSDELQMYVAEPVTEQETALKVAEEHYGFCSDIVDQGAGTIKALASMIMGSSVWYFWWD